MAKTDPDDPKYYARNVDCQHACPAGTNVPEYIRLIAAGHYTEAYLVNRHSNVFPGVLGRVCDRPCEPACRRGRLVGEQAVAICRLKRVAADFKDDISSTLFRADRDTPPDPRPQLSRVALIGAGPASLTVANDLLPLGYQVTVFEKDQTLGGAMRRAVPAFRLPLEVLDEEIGYITAMGLNCQTGQEIQDIKPLMNSFDAVFVGTGAPLGRDLNLPGRETCGRAVQIGLHWLSSVSFGHITNISGKVLVIGGGNTAMDCCRTALRLGAQEVHVAAPEGYDQMLALPWEKQDALEEGVVFHNNILPKSYQGIDETLKAVQFDRLASLYSDTGAWQPQVIPNQEETISCDLVILAIGQASAYDFLKDNDEITLSKKGLPDIDPTSLRVKDTNVFFGGDAAFGPLNIITAVAHGHKAALAIRAYLEGRQPEIAIPHQITLESQKMGLHEWSYGSAVSNDSRVVVPHRPLQDRFHNLKSEVELGYNLTDALKEAERCLNCDIQTVFSETLCIECDACIDICPTDCLTLTIPGDDDQVKLRLKAPFLVKDQNLFQSAPLPTNRIMAKDENVCLHCGLCAERCPTGAWDMQKLLLKIPQASDI